MTPCSAAAVHVIDFYLDAEREKEKVQILQLVHLDNSQSTELLRGFVREAMRMYHV
jgi:linoleate 10R-lipoxygenase